MIIYLAFGTPLAVYNAAWSRRWSQVSFAAIFVNFVLWPYRMADHAVRRLAAGDAAGQKHPSEIDRICAEIVSMAFDGDNASAVLELRECTARYAGLTLAMHQSETTRPNTELFAIVNHSKPRLAACILARRNRTLIRSHQTYARDEFLEMIGSIAATSDNGDAITAHAATLMDLLGDNTTGKGLPY